MVKVRDAKPEELAPKPRKPRALSPRQLAIKRREQVIEKVLNELGAGPASWIKKIELEDNEKLVTIRAAVARQIKASGSAVNLGVRNGAIFLSRGPIPGGRGGPAQEERLTTIAGREHLRGPDGGQGLGQGSDWCR